MTATGYSALRAVMRELPKDRVRGPMHLALGPCAIESEEQLRATAHAASEVGATYLRGGAVKLRTQVSSFQGLGATAWHTLSRVAREFGLLSVSEVTCISELSVAAQHLDLLQIGARSMWNYALLEAVAQTGRPVMLKRGLGTTTLDWLHAAARVYRYGASRVILCERGAPSTDPVARNAVDLSTILFLADESPLELWLDVSHSSGDSAVAMRLLEVAPSLGVDGAMAEIHPSPAQALCDSEQAISTATIRARGNLRSSSGCTR